MKELGKFTKQEETLVLGLEVKDENHPLNNFIEKQFTSNLSLSREEKLSAKNCFT